MAERMTGRPWSAHEDLLLSRAVAEFDGEADWKTIAQRVPGRTNKACRKRWLHSLSPSIKKSAWTKDEDGRLMSLYKLYGTKWSVIARQIPGRTDDACSKRYREALDPALKKDEWTQAEDVKLLGLYSQMGGRWVQVGQQLQRSSLGCRNRWRLLERKRSPAIREVTPTDSPMSPFQQASARSESLPAPELPSSWPMFDPSQYWPTQASLDFLPGLAPSHVEQMQVQQSSHPHRTNISLSSPEGGDFRTTHSMITPYRYPASFDPVFAALEQPQEIDYAETPEVPMQADILELQSSIASDPDTQSDSSSASALPCDVEMDSALTNQLDVGTREEESHNINEHPLDDPENAVSDYDNCQPPSPTPPPENASQQTNPVEANVVDRRLPRLSSMLATSSDLSIRGYACGHQRCLVSDSAVGIHFVTSKELSDHIRTDHAADEFPEHKPYRCGLPGCNKSWKSVNGLQYHLQVSKAHFLQAITTFTSTVPSTAHLPAPEASRKQKRPAKTHPCPHANCPQVYKQLSGLRYHLSHGHSHKSPVQLDIVPPTLARKVTERLQRQAANA
jgi:myb proto-oncogene protein